MLRKLDNHFGIIEVEYVGSLTITAKGGENEAPVISLQCLLKRYIGWIMVGLVHWGLTPQQQPGSYQGGELMMKSVFWWRKP